MKKQSQYVTDKLMEAYKEIEKNNSSKKADSKPYWRVLIAAIASVCL